MTALLYAPATYAQCQQEQAHCVKTEQWHFSLALGLGELSNPLHGGDDIPLVLIPYIHYYGEQFFIENNTLGYSFYQSEQLVVSAIAQLNREKAFFTQWQPSHLFLPNFSESVAIQPEDNFISKDDIKKRDWALDGGIQINWFIDPSLEVKAQLLHDINQVYQGFNAQLRIDKHMQLTDKTGINFGLGVNWHSQQLSDYYYGLDHQDQVEFQHFYQADSGISPFLAINLQHQLSQAWRAQLFIKREFIGQHISDSPLIKESHIDTAFVGVVYAF